MDELLHTLLTMSAAATVGALAVLVLRLFLKKAPRWITCLLWLAVFLRLVCPLSLPVTLPAVPAVQEIAAPVLSPAPAAEVAEAAPATVAEAPRPAESSFDPVPLLLGLWGTGTAGMLLWAVWSTRRLRRQVAEAVAVEPGVYESDQIAGPFLLGLLRPRIYLPVGLDG